MQLFIHPLSISNFYSSVSGDTLDKWPGSHTWPTNLQFRVSNQPNVFVSGLWEEAEVPGENQHWHGETRWPRTESCMLFSMTVLSQLHSDRQLLPPLPLTTKLIILSLWVCDGNGQSFPASSRVKPSAVIEGSPPWVVKVNSARRETFIFGICHFAAWSSRGFFLTGLTVQRVSSLATDVCAWGSGGARTQSHFPPWTGRPLPPASGAHRLKKIYLKVEPHWKQTRIDFPCLGYFKDEWWKKKLYK